MRKLRDMHYELLEHPLSSPDLELFLANQRFSSNQEAIAAVEGYFADLRKTTTGTG
jgi:hypothetical protein